MAKLTPDQVKQRNVILGWDADLNPDHGTITNLRLDTLEALVKAGFLDPEDAQNASPTADEFMGFMEQYPAITAHGYVIGADREDARVTIEGIACDAEAVTADMRDAFIEFARSADEFQYKTDLYAWWD